MNHSNNAVSKPHRPQLLVVDKGSQYTLKIVKSYEELGYRVALFGEGQALAWLKSNKVRGIIISGGPASVNDADAKPVAQAFYDAGVPVLNICYGMQDAAKRFGGNVESIEENRGYSKEDVTLATDFDLFVGLPRYTSVWASHGDTVTSVPHDFVVTARTDGGVIAAMYGKPNGVPVWCVQFHPEVSHTRDGKKILRNFAETICGCEEDWKAGDIVKTIRTSVLGAVGRRHAVIGFSGGVDSTTLARILAPVLGDRLHGIVIDCGQFRIGELEEIKRHAEAAGLAIKVISAKKGFTQVVGMKLNAEAVRIIFKYLYAEIFRQEAVKIANKYANGDLSQVVFIQGTLAPDLIESGATGGALIKSHHNVGLAIEGVEQLHPFGDLFKYEVRSLARKLKLPKSVWNRQPFPGPGLILRIPGLPKTPKNLNIVRWVDARTREVLGKHGWYDRVSQLVATYGFYPTVGVKGDGRVYEPVAVIRAVKTIDFMTAEGVYFPEQVARELVTVLTRHPKVSRVFFDPTNKPPATTEME
jgi:GMP synthase (glutamine-hydrolysing)